MINPLKEGALLPAGGGAPTQQDYFSDVYDFATLEAAYEAAFLFLDNAPEDAEEWLINLQNNLIWRSYEPGDNPDWDVVVLSAIEVVLKRYSLRLDDAGDDIKNIADALTLA